MQTIALMGGTGLVGTAAAHYFKSQSYQVVIFTRNQSPKLIQGIKYAYWNPQQNQIDTNALLQAHIIINLVGENVATQRWTDARKQDILNSRLRAAQLIHTTLSTQKHQVHTFIAATATGYYGEATTPFTENSPPHNDFLAQTCTAWEAALQPIQNLIPQFFICRLGIVLSTQGGAYKEFAKTKALKIFPVLGSGTQIISWIHIQDLVQIFEHLITQTSIPAGIYNTVAPAPVSNYTLMHTLRSLNHWGLLIQVPKWVLKLMLGQMSIEVLKTCTVSNQKLMQTQYSFTYPTIKQALQNLNNTKS
jgi:uncharacterized protein (TIGR01777 family)